MPSIIDNRVALRRELRVRGASYLLMCNELEGENSFKMFVFVFLGDENPGQKCVGQIRGGRVLHIVNTSGEAGAQIPLLPLGDDSSPCGR
jgi:hypothetical protein